MEDWACQTVLSCIIFQFKGELKYNLIRIIFHFKGELKYKLISNQMFLLHMIYIAL